MNKRTKYKILLLPVIVLSLFFAATAKEEPTSQLQPNIIFIFIDDMGWGDFSCFGNTQASTPQVDSIAREGMQFRQFYVNSPICSPSRVAVSTGCYPFRYGISSYLDNRARNAERGMENWLDPDAPTLARFLKQAGYATGHFGKWHMGGQRDVDDAPAISRYGFDASLTNFEGMGPKLLPLTESIGENGEVVSGRIWDGAERLGDGYQWMLRSEITGGFVSRAVEFINQAQEEGKPFYVNLWPDDVHTPMFPSIDRWSDDQHEKYLAVLEEMDAQFKPLFDRIRNDPKLKNNTILLICSDNGPERGCGSAGPFRGIKTTLYEGGVRSPLVVWAPGLMDANSVGTINEDSVWCGIDLVPTLLQSAGIEISDGVDLDGEALKDVLMGYSKASREAPIFFRRPPDRKDFRDLKNLPDLAMREGKWKFLCDFDGTRPELYDLSTDLSESENLALQYPELTQEMMAKLLRWNASMRPDAAVMAAQ